MQSADVEVLSFLFDSIHICCISSHTLSIRIKNLSISKIFEYRYNRENIFQYDNFSIYNKMLFKKYINACQKILLSVIINPQTPTTNSSKNCKKITKNTQGLIY